MRNILECRGAQLTKLQFNLRQKGTMDLAKSTGALKALRIFVDFEEESLEEIWAALEQGNPGLPQVEILEFWSVGHSDSEG